MAELHHQPHNQFPHGSRESPLSQDVALAVLHTGPKAMELWADEGLLQHCGLCCFLLQAELRGPAAPWKTGPFTVAGFVFGTLSRQKGQEQAVRKTS